MTVSLNDLSTSKQDKLTAGTGISISGATISCTVKAPSDYVKKDNGSLAVGSYAILVNYSSTSVANGNTIAGSNLYPVEIAYSVGDSDRQIDRTVTKASGTWRNVTGATVKAMSGGIHWYAGLFQRTA